MISIPEIQAESHEGRKTNKGEIFCVKETDGGINHCIKMDGV